MSAPTHYRKCVVSTCFGEKFDLCHKFPMDDVRIAEWLQAIKNHTSNPNLNDIPWHRLRKSFFVCSRHFRDRDYKNEVSRSLNTTAVPCINLTSLDQMTDEIMKRTVRRPAELDVGQTNGTGRNSAFLPREINSPISFETVKNSTAKRIASFNQTNEELTNGGGEEKRSKSDPLDASEETLQNDDLQLVQSLDGVELIQSPKSPSESTAYFIFDEVEESNSPISESAEEMPTDVFKENCLVEEQSENNAHLPCLQITHPKFDKSLVLEYFWLRDHCRCKECYNFETFQRKYCLLDIPEDIKPVQSSLEENIVSIIWSDDHKSEYDIDFLHENQFCNLQKQMETVQQELWDNKKILESNYALVSFNEYLTDESVAKNIVESLIRYGVAFVEKVPATMQMTETVVRRLFPIQKTFFGEMWTFSDVRLHSDTAYTREFLGAHTDNTYFNDAAGLQVFHCLRAAEIGGETFLVDGFNVLDKLKANHPKAYSSLCEIDVPAEYLENGKHHKYSAPIIRLNSITKKPEQIRYNLYDRAVLNTIPQNQTLDFYRSLRLLGKEVQADENEWWFKLQPGTVCIMDNWRLLHGRKAYKGAREMTGCYVSRTEFLSAARVMGVLS